MSAKVDTFFIADTHYHHGNMAFGQSTWDDKSQCRDFANVIDMNQAIVDNINAIVKPEDHLYHVGDFAFGRGDGPIIELRSRIKCKNVWLFLGNHDYRMKSKSSNLRGLFNKVRESGTLTINGQDIVFNHYPELIWDKHHYGSWHLHGHCHGTLSGEDHEHHGFLKKIFHDRKCMDVGIDTHPEFRPYHFDEVSAIMSKKKVMFLDHHTSNRV